MGSIPSTKNPNRNNQCTGRISRQLWVKAPTLSTGSSLSPSLAAAVWCWSSSRLAAASSAVSSAQARLVRRRRSASQLAAVASTVSVDLDCETWSCSASVPAAVYRPSRSTRIAKREAVQLPSWLQFLGPWARFEEDINPPTDSLQKISGRETATDYLPHWSKWFAVEMAQPAWLGLHEQSWLYSL